jgi:hypothetical protein
MKYIILFTLPSGSKWAASVYEGCFSMVQCGKSGKFESVLGFEIIEDAKAFMQDMYSQMDEVTKEKVKSLNPQFVMAKV